MKFIPALDVHERLANILEKLDDDFSHVRAENIICMRSSESKARAYARIWSMPSIWQSALGIEPHYVIEVLSQYYDRQSDDEKDKTLIHELMHIPKTFSGAVKSHNCFGKKINDKSVSVLHRKFKNS